MEEYLGTKTWWTLKIPREVQELDPCFLFAKYLFESE